MSELTKEYFDSFIAELTLRLDHDKHHLDHRLDEIEETLERIDKRDVEDSDAFAKDIVNLQRRVGTIERQLKLKPAS